MFAKYIFFQVLLSLSCFRDAASDGVQFDSLNSLCNFTSSVRTSNDSWRRNSRPDEDDLDRLMVRKTGCTYEALEFYVILYPLSENYEPVLFDGALFEWRGAVRARGDALLQLSWGNSTDHIYNFFIGEEDNKITRMFQWGTDNVWIKPTPDILSIDRYVPFYIRLQADTLTFGRECDREPLLRRNVSVARGQPLYMFCKSWSAVGGKFLYNCPAQGNAGWWTGSPLLLLLAALIATFMG